MKPYLDASRKFEAWCEVHGWRPPGAAPETLPVHQNPYWTPIALELCSFPCRDKQRLRWDDILQSATAKPFTRCAVPLGWCYHTAQTTEARATKSSFLILKTVETDSFFSYKSCSARKTPSRRTCLGLTSNLYYYKYYIQERKKILEAFEAKQIWAKIKYTYEWFIIF